VAPIVSICAYLRHFFRTSNQVVTDKVHNYTHIALCADLFFTLKSALEVNYRIYFWPPLERTLRAPMWSVCYQGMGEFS
jgi:hypothetical protein